VCSKSLWRKTSFAFDELNDTVTPTPLVVLCIEDDDDVDEKKKRRNDDRARWWCPFF